LPSWAGRRVWVIGASSGIGRATAALLHARGAQVVVSARGESALNQFTQAHPGSVAVALDSTDAKAVQAAADGLRAQGPLHLVCYCAGIYESQSAADFDLAAMLRHDDVNYRGALHVLAAVFHLCWAPPHQAPLRTSVWSAASPAFAACRVAWPMGRPKQR
jgi:NAD(P)-dependent dehydrogenase (short-subunit alcohol dehydrogenase family)